MKSIQILLMAQTTQSWKEIKSKLLFSFKIELMNTPIKNFAPFLLLLCIIVACTQQPQQVVEKKDSPTRTAAFFHGEKPAPIKARYVDPDSITPPEVVPLNGQPKRVPAHPNVHPAGQPEVNQVPDNLRTFTLGKDGVPLPKTVPAKGKVVPAKHVRPIPAKDFRTKDAAIYDIQYLSDEQGLKSSSIVSILEDSRGHIWFGTTDDAAAALRYDGERIFEYTTEEGLVISEGVASMLEDSKGNIWFGGRGGVCYYDGHNFVQFVQEEVNHTPHWGYFMEDRKGNIWFFNDNLVRYDGENFTIYETEYILANDGIKQESNFSNRAIKEIMEDSRGHIWIATSGNGVLRFDGQHFIQLTREDGLVDNHISNLLEDGQGNIWIGSGVVGTIGKGVSRFTPDTSKPHIISGTTANFDRSHGLSGNRIQEILKDDVGNIWFATYDGGICQFDGKIFTHFTKEEGMSFDAVLGMIKDSQGNLWAGTNGGGISKFNPNGFRHFSQKHGLGQGGIGVGLEDRKGNIWISNFYNGVHKYDGQQFTNFTIENGLLQNFVSNFMEDRDGNIWIVYRDKGASKFDGKYFTHYKTKSLEFYWDIHEDAQGMIWFASGWQGGVSRLDPATGNVTNYKGAKKECIGCGRFLEDSQGDLWFVGSNHVAKLDKEQERIEFVCQVDTVVTDWVDFMIEDMEGNVWFGSPTAITQVKQKGVEIIHNFPRYFKGKELPDVLMVSLVDDRDGNLWVGSGGKGLLVSPDGLEHIGTDELKWLQYGKADGLKNMGFFSGLLDHRNRLWLGSNAYLTLLDLNTFRLPTEAPRNLGLSHIELQQLYIDYTRLSDSTYCNTLPFGEKLDNSFDSVVAFRNYPISLKLPYDINHLTFHFSADDWNAPHQIQYSYKMDGIDDGWSPPNGEAKAEFRNLPHGTFTFQVKAIGVAKKWSEPFYYTFTIRPPWWHTWWAYVLYGLLIIIGLVKAAQIQRKWVREKALAEAQEKELEQAREIEKAYIELKATQNKLIHSEKMASLGELTAGIAHEIQNPLNFVNNFSEVSNEMLEELREGPFMKLPEEEKKEADEIFNDLSQNLEKILHHGKRADGIVKSMLLHSRNSGGSEEPTNINVLADEYLRLAYHGLRAKDKSFNATLITEFDENIIDVSIVPQSMGRVILNLINNAFYAVVEKSREQPNEYQPTVSVITRKVDNGIEIVVKDNGNGIPKKIIDKIFQPFFTTKPTGQGTGLGLSLSYDIVKAHGGEISVNSEEGIGTEFKISLLK